MIENISTLVGNSKIVNTIRRRKNIIDTPPSSASIDEAKARVQKILDEGSGKRRRKKKSPDKS